jgi:L-rhamnose mutarotase
MPHKDEDVACYPANWHFRSCVLTIAHKRADFQAMLTTETIAARMLLRPGAEAEYRRRHDQIWPELVTELKAAGIRDYRIFLDPENHCLFAVITRTTNHRMDDLPRKAVMQRWWAMMADLMVTEPDSSPQLTTLQEMFCLSTGATD